MSPGPAVHLRGRGQVRSPDRNRESQFPGRGGRPRSRLAGLFDRPLSPGRVEMGCFRPGWRSREGGAALGERNVPESWRGRGRAGRGALTSGGPSPSLPGPKGLGDSESRHLVGGSVKSQGSGITAVDEKGPQLRGGLHANLTETQGNHMGWSEIWRGLCSIR